MPDTTPISATLSAAEWAVLAYADPQIYNAMDRETQLALVEMAGSGDERSLNYTNAMFKLTEAATEAIHQASRVEEEAWYFAFGMSANYRNRQAGPFPTSKAAREAARDKRAMGWSTARPKRRALGMAA